MSAERHALDAALQFSAKLEQQIKEMRDEIHEQRMRNITLREQLRGVKDAVSDRPSPENTFQGPMFEQAAPEDPFAHNYARTQYPKCKNCGCPV